MKPFTITISVSEINGYLKATKVTSGNKDVDKYILYGLVREALKLVEKT